MGVQAYLSGMSSIPTPQPQTTDHDETTTAPTCAAPETERERIRAAAREAAAQFPPMSSELVTLRGRTG